MRITPRARRVLKPAMSRSFAAVRPVLTKLGLGDRSKYLYESLYWKQRKSEEGTLDNTWYEGLFTTLVGLDRHDYAGKRVLDVGCGPRGSLEWADHAARRVGLDPLVPAYRRLGIDDHAMEYLDAPAERMPLADGSFDIVTSINSLDHVDDVDAALREMRRVLAPGGLLLIAVEVGHAPTIAEPHRLEWELEQRLPDGFDIEAVEHFEFLPDQPGVSKSLRRRLPFDHGDGRDRSGTLLLRARAR